MPLTAWIAKNKAFCRAVEHCWSSLTQGPCVPTWSVQIVSRKVSTSILYESKLILKAIFRASVLKEKKKYRTEERCTVAEEVEQRRDFCCFLNSDIRMFRLQSEATREVFELTASFECWFELFFSNRSQHQMWGSKCVFCTFKEHSYRSFTSNFMPHQVKHSWSAGQS